jgi:ATP-dependent DNA helicase RecG
VNLPELQELVAQRESERLEFKKSTGDLKGGMETLCAFLNGQGGRVLFGVSTAGAIRGQDVTENTLREVANDLVRLEPPAHIVLTRVPVDGTREVLVLETTLRNNAPYTYNGRPYRRIGTNTTLMPQAEYQHRLLERGHAQQRWENQPAVGYTVADLDENEIRRTVTDAVAAGRLESVVTDPTEVLQKLHLLAGDQPLQAAVVAFATDPLPNYPQCALRLARFRGTTKDEFLDQRQLTGRAFLLLREADLFLRQHLPVRGRFESGVMERIDEPLFPPLALREALVNALIHRDYSIYGGAVSVAVYDDRLEIISSGTLPFGMTVEDLTRDHESRPRNPLLADVFYRRGLIERWGRGTQKIIELCRAAGQPEPEFEQRAGDVVVRFIPSDYTPPHRVGHDLTERQRRILHALRDGQRRPLRSIKDAVDPNLPDNTLRNDLVLLRNLGLVESRGRGVGATWNLKPC